MDWIAKIFEKMDESEKKAIDALSRYKFWMFGYHAAAWIKYNQLLPKGMQKKNPFRPLVQEATRMKMGIIL
jgi:hypothetical protein